MSGSMNVIAKSVKWQDPSKFKIYFDGKGANAAGFSDLDPDLLSVSCTGIQLAEINASPIEEYIGEQWRFASGRLENYQITITFKDYNNFTLYKLWTKAIQDFLREYPEDQYFTLNIQTADAFDVDNFSDIVKFQKCYLTAVSGATLDNSAIASVAEFSVTFKAAYVEVL